MEVISVCNLRPVVCHPFCELVPHFLVSTELAILISKSNVKDGARTVAHSLRIRDERLSGPDALLASSPDNIF